MKHKFILALSLVMFSTPAFAVEMTNTTTSSTGWAFHYQTIIPTKEFPKGKPYTIELPVNKCAPSDLKRSCFATEHEARHFAEMKANSAEKIMRQALAIKK